MLAGLSISLLAAALVRAPQVASGDLIGQRVSIVGVVSSAVRDDLDDGFNWILLKTPEGTVCASTDKTVNSLESLQQLVDAEIELTGVVQRFTQLRKFLGCQMLFDAPDKGDRIRVIKPAPEDPFSAQPLSTPSYPHRQKATGAVIAITGDSFFIRYPNGFIQVRPTEGTAFPALGATVTVSGFSELNRTLPVLSEALWRTEPIAPRPPEPAIDIPARALFLSSERPNAYRSVHRYVNTSLNGQSLRLAGRVEAVVRNSNGLAGLRINCDGEPVFINLSGFPSEEFTLPEVGSRISAAGLCYADFDMAGNAMFPRFLGFSLIPRTNEDIAVLEKAPFWNVRHLMLTLAVVILLAAALAIWSVVLKIVSTRRGHELAREQIRGARAELKVEERTRLAVELHDSISQTLTGVALQIDAAAGADAAGSKVFLATARNMLASCRQELNGCLWDLRSRTFEEKDMTEAVQRTLAPHVGSAKLTVRFNVPREKLSEQTAHAVLRIIRELGTNAVKHGNARSIKIAGEFHDDIISFSVLDDGRGFDTASAPGPAQGHFGLQGVRERLNEFNGTIRCDSEPGCGAKFTVTLHTTTDETE